MSENNSKNEDNQKSKPKVKLTDKERIMALEENVEFLHELVETMLETQRKLLEGYNTFITNNTKNESELSRWSQATEKRIRSLLVQQFNTNLVINEAIHLTPEQELRIQEKVEEMKSQKRVENKGEVNPKNEKGNPDDNQKEED